MKHDSFNESAEMYLKTIAELAVSDKPVPISALAGRMGVSAVSATEMIHRLQDHGLLDHLPYKGVYLTTDGQYQAVSVIRSHRLWECFLTDHLGFRWEQAHDLACRLEHATDPQVTEALDVFLGHPAVCPHGNPIPAADGGLDESDDQPLSSMRPGQKGTISRIYPESRDLLAYLSELELETGTQITLREIVPFQGPLVLMTCMGLRYLGQEAAEQIFVRSVGEAL